MLYVTLFLKNHFKSLSSTLQESLQSITDVECRIVNLEDHSGGHYSKKICEDVPTEKCVPVPVKIEGQKCVNIPTQVRIILSRRVKYDEFILVV